MEIPPEIKINYTLEQGYTYYFMEESFSSDDPHYFVILNSNLDEADDIYFVNATSQIVKVRDRQSILGRRPDSYVEVKKEDCSFLTKDSIFDCNSVTKKSKQSLIDKVSNEELGLVGSIDQNILDKIIAGVLLSPLVEERVKQQLR